MYIALVSRDHFVDWNYCNYGHFPIGIGRTSLQATELLVAEGLQILF